MQTYPEKNQSWLEMQREEHIRVFSLHLTCVKEYIFVIVVFSQLSPSFTGKCLSAVLLLRNCCFIAGELEVVFFQL